MITNWFLITSAINVEYGIFSAFQRYQQTIETINSIKKYCPNNKIIILESSPTTLPDEWKNNLLKLTHLSIDFSGDKLISTMHRELPLNAIKSPCEIYIINQFLIKENIVHPNDRIYKISGRYRLHSTFDPYLHNKEKNRLVFGTKFAGIRYYNKETGESYPKESEWQYKTRLYSFCGSLKHYMIQKYDQILNYFQNLYGTGFTDLEHAMYKFLDHNLVTELPYVGLTGIFADRKELVVE